MQAEPLTGLEIAVVGLAGRFPGAPGLEAFWRNLCDGVESITFFSEEELQAAGIDAAVYGRPGYVPARGALDGVDLFDAALFDYSPREAELIDPQQRLFLECAWEALENAGYDPWQISDPIGLYAGCGANTYLVNLLSNPELLAAMGTFQVTMANDKDYLATRTSFKLNLRGPSLAVQTACSTSLVAVHVACQGLLAGEARMALAGGVKVVSQERSGYVYREGGIDSPDGHCRTFDARARGTVSGSGVGVVVLKRLADALADGDRVWAVIKGSAVNNDGAVKAGYTAPSVDGQAAVVRLALAIGEVAPESVGYVEAHGTATELGDPVEIAALTRVFAEGRPAETPPCAVGSVKSNIGHLDAAAGVAGLIKTVLALDRGLLPPSLHCEVPNPEIDFERTPFRVQRTLAPWTGDGPRRAGVSSFGIGGTNAHLVLEQAPAPQPSGPGRPWQLLLLSARTGTALERRTDDLAAHLRESTGESLADVAFTCHVGRRRLGHRRMAVCRDAAEAAGILAGEDPERLLTRAQEMTGRPVVFLFPGQGAQYAGMGRGLYPGEPAFREALDRCSEILRPLLGLDLRQTLGFGGEPAADLAETWLAQPALFAVGYALAALWREWGVHPAALLGHSVGEYLAACLAEVMTLEDALALVALRGRLMQEMGRGSMLSVPLAEAELAPGLGGDLSVAAVNGPEHTVVSGETAAIEDLRRRLEERGVAARLLHTSHAFHSALMDPVVAPFRVAVAGVRLQPPRLPWLSNLTGDWITPEQATDPGYWADHLRRPVLFGQGLGRLLDNPRRIFLEVGPGRTLTTLAKAHPAWGRSRDAFSSLRHPQEAVDDLAFLLTSAGRLWLAGADLDGAGLYRGQRRQRVPLPTYPFERQRYWIEPAARPGIGTAGMAPVAAEGVAEEALPAPAAAHVRPDLETSYVAPRTPVEETVAGIWQSLLGIGQVGVLDNFFELGGHSLLATQVIARLRQAFGLEVSLRTLFEVPTVAGVARAVEERLATAAEDPADGLPTLVPDLERRSEPFPLTDVQQAYWIGRTDALDLGNVATHAYTEVELTGLDLERFEAALRRVVERQGMLRAIVQPDGRQRILERVPPYEIRTLDLAGVPDGEARRALAAVREEMSHQVLPSDRWPLFEVRASRLDGERVRLHFSFDFLLGDAWSFRVLFAELGRFYLEPGAAVPPLELSFRDYVLAEEALQETPVYRRSLEYWRGRLADLPPAPDLPLARHPSQVERPRFTRRTGGLPPAAWDAVRTRAGRAGLTPSGVLLTAFGEVLSRWSKSPRFTLNLTLFNRLPLHPQVNELVGDFTSLTLLEVDASGRAPFLEQAQRLQRRLWEDLDHRHVGGVRVMRELAQAQGQRRGVAMPVVFTSLLGLSGGGGDEEAELLGISGEVVYSISQTPQVWIDHQAAEGPSGLSFNWDVVEELFPEGLVDQLFGAYTRLLGRLAEDDEAWHRPVEARDLGAWPVPVAAGRLAVPAGATLHGLFVERAAREGDRPALVSGARTVTYAELDRLTDRLAARLRRLGARPNRLVAVVMEKGWEQAAATLAVLKAGAAYLPVAPALPRERRFHLLSQGEAEVALIQPWLADRLEWPEGVTLLPVAGEGMEDEPAAPLPPAQDPESLAYVIFTSGSTGLPKGVMIDHRGAVNTVLDVNQRFQVGRDDRVLAVSSLSFDLSVYDIFGLLAAGGVVVFPEPSPAPDPARWLELLHREGVTLWNTVPALLELLVDSLGGRASGLPASLRLFLLSGDWIPVSLPGRVRELRPDSRIVSLGGATEASIWSILYEIEDVDPAWKSIPYGRAMANQSFHVLDGRMEPRPVWVPGDLHIGGVGVALGYWRDAARTQASFPVDATTGERLYRTGDLGRLLPDGNIEFLGREDQQVKVLGHRIELGEIEAALEEHPAVRSGVVAAVGEDRARRRLVAYVVPQDGAVPAEEDLAGFLGERLPAYMVPARFLFLEALPLSPNGKVDRRALPLPDESRPEVSEPARTPTEEVVAGIWADALGLARIGVHDDFFAAGGDSLQAVRVLTRLREAFDVDLSLRQIFEAPTVAGLAARVEEARGGGGAVRLPAIEPGPRGGEAPLSSGQERLWVIDRLSPGHPAYILPLPVRLLGRLDPAAFERALTGVVRRHDALRTSFPMRGDAPVQAVAAPAPVHVPRIDLRSLPEPVREAELSRLIASDARRPFDLASGPLLRTLLARVGEAEHAALFTLHHIVTDGWSMDILVREVAALYAAEGGRDAALLPDLPVQYTDYARWQRRHLTDDFLAGQLAYWQERLAGAPPRLELPTDRPRPAAGAAPGARLAVRFPAELGREAVALSRSRGVTPFMTFLAVFQVLLQRYSGQTDLLVGTPVANRGRTEIEGLIGFFVNTLVLRVDLSGDPTFGELLTRVRAAALDGFARPDLPFERLVQELQPERDPSTPPLFQVLFALQNAPASRGSLEGLTIAPIEAESAGAQFDLSLSLTEGGGGLRGWIEYRADLFLRPTIVRLLGHFESLLAGALARPELRIGDLPLLRPAELHQVRCEWGWSDEADPGLCLHELFAAQAQLRPDAWAVVQGEERLTYAELDRRANRLAHRLRRLGVGPETPVGLCAERSPALVVGLLGILKAGGGYVPLDPGYPAERLSWILEDSQAGLDSPVLVAQEKLLDSLPGSRASVVLLDELDLMEEPAGEIDPGASPGSLAYVIYTSGSTGRPKGVPIQHRNATRLFASTDAWFGFSPGDVWTLFHSYAFDFSVWEIWGALLYGGRLVIIPYLVSRSPEAFYELLLDEGVTVLNQTPSAFRQLVAAEEAVLERRADGGRELALRFVIFGGEALEIASLHPWFERHGDEHPRLINMYGITETTVHVTYRPVRLADLAGGLTGRIGGPIPDLRLVLIDRDLNPVPIGVPGEILVGGAGLGSGYLHRPELTAERFIPDPLADLRGEPGARLYRSGDLARRRTDGDLEYLGRIDHQVKIRGFRVELGEIEAALAAHPGVREAAVVTDVEGTGLRLLAYVAAGPGREAPAAAELREHLRRILPEPMIPAVFVSLEALPLTPHGKIDRRALPRPAAPSPISSPAARTPAEELIAGVLAAVLGLPEMGVEDDFFEMGGHSLLATRAASALKKVFGVDIPLPGFFAAPTARGLAELVAAQGPAVEPPLVPVPRGGALPLSFAQERLWFVHQLAPGSPAYNIPAAARLSGRLEPPVLESGLRELVRRHETLRTTFAEEAGTPVQVIASEAFLVLPVVDLRGLPPEAAAVEAQRRAAAEAALPFDLARGPVLRAVLLALGPEEHVLLITLHHIASDGWSMAVLLREAMAFYAALSAGRPAGLPPLTVQYADFAVWQRAALAGEALADHLDYWRQRLAGAPPSPPLPTDRPRPPVQRSHGAEETDHLDAPAVAGLRAVARQESATLFMALLAAFCAYLHDRTGETDVVVGTDIANRNRAETEPLIGFFVNQLALRVDLSGDPTFRELLARVRRVALEAYRHQDLPFDRVVEAVSPRRDPSRSPLFQVKLGLQNLPRVEGEAGLRVLPFRVERVTSKLDLSLNAEESPRGLHLSLQYDTDLFDAATVRRLLAAVKDIVHLAADSPDAPLTELGRRLAALEREREEAERRRLAEDEARLFQAVRRRPVRPSA